MRLIDMAREVMEKYDNLKSLNKSEYVLSWHFGFYNKISLSAWKKKDSGNLSLAFHTMEFDVFLDKMHTDDGDRFEVRCLKKGMYSDEDVQRVIDILYEEIL